ncbi:DUF1641 domain-containing protein [Mycolicibacterium sp.]|uniref:DUF1641 domain-containing protein n=1 Tax=Mycolicibacterium sp. TaxID=2320850 RepID=UPI003D0F29CF
MLDTRSPADTVRARLDDPRVAEALNDLLDHADLLAVLVTGLDGLVRRGDDITANLSSAIGELSGSTGQLSGLAGLKDIDLAGLAASLGELSGGLTKAAPALNTLLTSSLADQRAIAVITALGDALVEARDTVPAAPRGLRGVWKTMRVAAKDPDVSKGLVYLIEVAKHFGRAV